MRDGEMEKEGQICARGEEGVGETNLCERRGREEGINLNERRGRGKFARDEREREGQIRAWGEGEGETILCERRGRGRCIFARGKREREVKQICARGEGEGER